jgi:hypothetical protein
MDTIIFIIALVPWVVAMWAMFMMIVTAFKNEQFQFGWFFGGSFVLADYNRKYFRTFAVAVLIDVGFVASVNALFLVGWLKF